MQSFNCATGSTPSTRNLRNDKNSFTKRSEDKDYEKKLGCKRTKVRPVCRAVRHRVQLRSHAPLELVDAGGLWLAPHQLLAGTGSFAPQQDPFRRIPRRTGPPHLAAPHDGTLGGDDPGRARKVPPRHARSLWFVWTARCGAESLIGEPPKSPVDFCFLFAYID